MEEREDGKAVRKRAQNCKAKMGGFGNRKKKKINHDVGNTEGK